MHSLDALLSKDRQKPEKEWQNILSEYVEDLGVEEITPGMYPSKVQNHPVFHHNAGDMNWSRLMPDDSVSRLKQTDNIYEEFVNIVQNTAKNLERISHRYPKKIHLVGALAWDVERIANTSVEPPDKAYIAGQIIRRLSGNVNLHNPEAMEIDTNTPPNDLTILVTSINDRNFEDWLVFEIENASIFDESFQLSTHMLKDLRENDLDPDLFVQNVAFDVNGVNIPSTSPKGSISVVSMSERRDHCSYTTIEQPEKLFKNNWGVIEQMIEILDDDIREDYFRLDWTISAGMRW